MCRCVRVCRQIAQDLAGHNKGFFFLIFWRVKSNGKAQLSRFRKCSLL